ncbi:MAG: disulfide bond formation protein B [Alphaproteobacteria bacterium]|nr:disulfide bond formation protein B [Alphaproteobacteria bacterium]
MLVSIARFFTTSRLLLALAGFSAAMLATALIGQYGFNLHPCHLCILQRYPYAAIIALGLLGFFVIKSPKIQKNILLLCIALLFVDGSIAFYHAGVEMGIFPGPSDCTSSGKTGQTIEEIRAEIMGAPLVACDQAMIHILGLSMAAWNAIAAFGAGTASALIFYTGQKK